MARPKKAKTKAAKASAEAKVRDNAAEPVAAPVAVAEPSPEALQPPTQPVETPEAEKAQAKEATQEDKDRVAATAINIAKLQAMSMPELNQMARELGVDAVFANGDPSVATG